MQVGRPRPSFMARCWPDGMKPEWDTHGNALCAPNAVNVVEGRKSFPSGWFPLSSPSTERPTAPRVHLPPHGQTPRQSMRLDEHVQRSSRLS
jgi:hypothetical protein